MIGVHDRIPERKALQSLLEGLSVARDQKESFGCLCHCMENVGFNGVIFVSRTSETDWKETISETSFPEAWVAHYIEKGYGKLDPARRYCFRSNHPFFWTETYPHFRKKELVVFHEAREFGLRSGVAAPIFSGGVLVGAIGLASDAGKLDDPRLKSVVDLATQMFGGVYRELARATLGNAGDEEPSMLQLTKREMQILGMLADGLTTHQLAERLGISQSTVEYHLHNVFSKIDVENRVSAVVKAIRLGLIDA